MRVLARLIYIIALVVLVLAPWWHALLVFLLGLCLHTWGAYLQYSSNHTVEIRRRPW